MTTSNLDATGHQWVGALVRFNFQLEYQKGWDNTVADVLSCITTHLSPEAVWSILDGVTLGVGICDPRQTAKTIAKFLYQSYISIYGAPARLLSDRGANFMNNMIEEMCKILGIKKLYTIPYHLLTNGLVDRSHQMIMQMIGKLGEDKNADWPSHLAEIVHAYNATHFAVTRYSPHYLMFG